jgi:membrane fusion protein (multidrug efflux system)
MTTQTNAAADGNDANGAAPKGKKRFIKFAVLALVLLAAASYLIYWFAEGRHWEHTDDAYVGGDITVIAPKVPGNIAKVLVADNQAVQAGDLLARIDDRDYRAALNKADAAVAAARKPRWPTRRRAPPAGR